MEDYSYLFNSNWFWCFCGILGGGCLSLIISYFFYFITSKIKCISYRIKTSPVSIDAKNHYLKDKINSKNIKLYFSKIIIRNVSNLDIEKNDFVPYCPITISINGLLITYAIKSNYYSNVTSTNNYDVANIDKIVDNISINLDYLAKNDTIECSCLHTGEISINALLKNGRICESYLFTKFGKLYVELTYFIYILGFIFLVLYGTLIILAIVPELFK